MLHAKELMIGDWVKFPGGAIDKVVDMPYIEGKGICASFAASATLFPFPISKIEPIPITPEILEKNGFIKQRFERWEWVEQKSDGTDLTLIVLWRRDFSAPRLSIRRFEGSFADFSAIGVEFVQQLQHALRLCGIEKEIEL